MYFIDLIVSNIRPPTPTTNKYGRALNTKIVDIGGSLPSLPLLIGLVLLASGVGTDCNFYESVGFARIPFAVQCQFDINVLFDIANSVNISPLILDIDDASLLYPELLLIVRCACCVIVVPLLVSGGSRS